jgi:hypothetical protein
MRCGWSQVVLILGSLAAGLSAGEAALVWPEPLVELRPDPNAATVQADFRFENRGSRPVTIVRVEAACECTPVAMEKTVYAAGEAGQVGVLFTLGERGGVQNKAIEVHTDDPVVPVVRLTLRVHLPERPEIRPLFLRWMQGAAPLAQEASISIPAGSPWRILGLAPLAAEARFRAELVPEVAPEAGSFRLRVTPVDTAADAFQTIGIRVRIGEGPERTLAVHARVVGRKAGA